MTGSVGAQHLGRQRVAEPVLSLSGEILLATGKPADTRVRHAELSSWPASSVISISKRVNTPRPRDVGEVPVMMPTRAATGNEAVTRFAELETLKPIRSEPRWR